MKNAYMPAAPCATPNDPRANEQARAHGVHVPDFNVHTGLTKREMMAMHMMAALLSSPGGKFPEQTSVYIIIDDAVNMADAMLSKLDRSQGESK